LTPGTKRNSNCQPFNHHARGAPHFSITYIQNKKAQTKNRFGPPIKKREITPEIEIEGCPHDPASPEEWTKINYSGKLVAADQRAVQKTYLTPLA
jgi:hypothetical protein